jgi:hypothetical protein
MSAQTFLLVALQLYIYMYTFKTITNALIRTVDLLKMDLLRITIL